MNLQLVYRGLELPRKPSTYASDKLHRYLSTLVDPGDRHFGCFCLAGLAIQAGYFTEDVIERYQRKAKGEHSKRYKKNRLINRCSDIQAPYPLDIYNRIQGEVDNPGKHAEAYGQHPVPHRSFGGSDH